MIFRILIWFFYNVNFISAESLFDSGGIDWSAPVSRQDDDKLDLDWGDDEDDGIGSGDDDGGIQMKSKEPEPPAEQENSHNDGITILINDK